MAGKQVQWLGRIVLIRPLAFGVLAGFAAACALTLLAFFSLTSYTQRARVPGVLEPATGLIKINSPQAALVLERRVREGQSVRAGDVLFVLSNERPMQVGSASLNEAVLAKVEARQESLKLELAQAQTLSQKQADQLSVRLNGMEIEASQLDRQIATAQARVASSEAALQRYRDLAAQQYFSAFALQQKQDELLDQQSRLQALEQQRLQFSREILANKGELAQLAQRASREQEQLGRALNELEQSSLNTSAQRKILVTAPQDGIVTALLAQPGQMSSNQALLTLLPAGARLQAQLYAPSSKAGFVHTGQKVRLRYAAYPYQKFGQFEGVVAEVSRTALATEDLPGHLPALKQSGEGLYRITVDLAGQELLAYGKRIPLTAGMSLEADVLQDTRRLIEWVFEPLLTLGGKL